jgi:hypothetical protein
MNPDALVRARMHARSLQSNARAKPRKQKSPEIQGF